MQQSEGWEVGEPATTPPTESQAEDCPPPDTTEYWKWNGPDRRFEHFDEVTGQVIIYPDYFK